MSDKHETKGDAKGADAKTAEAKPAPKTKHHALHDTLPFVKAGGQLVNLAHVVSVVLPAEGKPLTLTLVSGGNLSLIGDDAAAALAALGECCDVG